MGAATADERPVGGRERDHHRRLSAPDRRGPEAPLSAGNPQVTAAQCHHILGRCCKAEDFSVVVLSGSGHNPQLEDDAGTVAGALAKLGWRQGNA